MALLGAACLLPLACQPDRGDDDDDDDPHTPPVIVEGPIEFAPLTSVFTAAEQTLVPVNAPLPQLENNPAEPEFQPGYLLSGLGDVEVGPGEPAAVRTIDLGPAPRRGPNPRRLARFVHLADSQLMDDESPTRTAIFDNVALTSGAMRPQDPDVCRMLHAVVRTVNALHRADPIDFVLLGGDNADNAQDNEVRWVMDILSGGEVECDSGDDDDLVEGRFDGNDGKDPFISAGLAMPWKWVTGNHDVNVQGNFRLDAQRSAATVGTVAENGTRDYAFRRLGAVRQGDFVVADERRRLLDGPSLIELVGDHGDGHGLKDADRSHGKAFYSFDVGDDLTFVVLDTNALGGGASGQLSLADVERFVIPAFETARAQNRAVVIASHHALDSLTVDGGTFGTTVDDALLPDEWRALLAQYPHVVMSMVAHTHRHRVVRQETAPGQAFFEVMTSAIADYPHQFRIVEIWDDDNGSLRVEAIPVDFSVEDDDVAARGRALG
ncbi:MAG TPA: metallophosphoesterase, partial [Myxococcota bacterium]